MAKSPLNRTTAPQVVRLFDYCFRQGVTDASDFGDDIAVQEWLDRRLADGQYGLLSGYDEVFDWKRWRLVLYRWCRMGRLGGIGERYVDQIHRYKATSAFALLPMAMRFYLMGVEEWLAYPNQNNMAQFKQTKKMLPDFSSQREKEKYYLVIINKGKTKMEGKADLVFHDSIGKVMNQIEV